MASHKIKTPDLLDRPIDLFLLPFQQFARIEAAGGILLLLATGAALVWANSPWAGAYDDLWHTYLKFAFGEHELKLSLHHFVNDGLMAIFFFVVGLEIKRELLVGELSDPRKAALSITAAVGGMVVPGLVFFALNPSGVEARGWAIPMATDIAFAVGVMAMLGSRVPLPLKVFVTAAAIVDDIGAIVIIAVFYTDEISVPALVTANVLLSFAFVAGRLGVRSVVFYGIIGTVMWLMLLKSGVHATVGGVLLALTIPAQVRVRGAGFVAFGRKALDEFEEAGGDGDAIISNEHRQRVVFGLERACEHVQTPLNRMEHGLHPIVSYVIMPVFALGNAGIPLTEGFGDAIGSGVGLGVALGLIAGKPLGIGLASLAAVKLGLAKLPSGVTWRHIIGAGFLAGIGFTMSLFISGLAYRGDELGQVAKIGILGGSLVSGVVGYLILQSTGKRAK